MEPPLVISTREVSLAQDRLVDAVADLADEDLRAPSRCPGWTRAHVLTHVARNADGMVNLATWALTGEVTPMYEAGRRDADIEAGATRSADELVADLVATNARVLDALGSLEGAVATDPTVAEREVRLGQPDRGRPTPVRRLPFLRLQEVVVHHHDLDDGLRAREWPPEYVAAGLPWVWRRMAARLDDPPTLRAWGPEGHAALDPPGSAVEVQGAAADLLVWLLGRADRVDRARLSVRPPDAGLPALPPW